MTGPGRPAGEPQTPGEPRTAGGTADGPVLRLAEWLIGRACWNLPAGIRADRYREWTAELPHIRHDPEIALAPVRVILTLLYAADQSRATRPRRRPQVARRARAQWLRLRAAGTGDRLRPVVIGGVVGLGGGGSVTAVLGGIVLGILCVISSWAYGRLAGSGRLATVASGLRRRRIRHDRPPDSGA